MTEKKNIIKTNRKKYSFFRSTLFLSLIILFFLSETSVAQVISNTGAAISVSSVVVVNTRDYINTTGALGNDGIINLTGNLSNNGASGILSNNGTLNLNGNFYNAGTSGGNGYFNIRGNWTNINLFNPGTSTVTLNGTNHQIITHWSSGENFYRLIINNPGKIITQIASSGSSLTILNDLDLTAGTLSLDQTTTLLTVGGKATILGSLVYSNLTTQTTSIANNLSGTTGLIDMSPGNRPHVLNLAGGTNSIGTFTTSPTGSSSVNYNGTTQTVFPALNYRNLTISNSGIKTLQGRSKVGLRLNISGGTFDLGTITDSLRVLGSATINGSLSFNGSLDKIVTLNDSLTGTGSIDMSGGNRAHLLYLYGPVNSIGTYSSGSASTVEYIRGGNQSVFTSDDYRNLRITGSGIKTLYGDITTKGVLTMSAGDIDANGNTLKVTNGSVSAINRTAGKIIGKLQRTIGVTGSEYLYPLGSAANYNPLKIKFRNSVSGPVTAQFKLGDVGGTASLPLDDDDEQIWDRFTEGYWSMTSASPMSSSNFAVNLNTTGFTGVDLSSRIIKRTDGGNLEVDGRHDTLSVLPEIKRDSLLKGISTITTDLAIGKGRPRITSQPSKIDVCEGSPAWFQLTARGRGSLSYRWQVDVTGNGTSFGNIFDGPVGNGASYSGTNKRRLDIASAPYGMNGWLYRCIITDAQGNSNITDPVLLTVNKIPIAIANLYTQDECPGVAIQTIILTTNNSVTGTTFGWTRDNPAGISTSMPLSVTAAVGDQINGIFTNSLDYPVTVTFTITPTGPWSTYCVGNSIVVKVTVNPIPKILPVASTIQCDSTYTSLQLQSPSTFTVGGLISFKYTVATTGPVSGFVTPSSGKPNNYLITDKLVNQTDVYQMVTYTVVPVSPVGCVDGPSTDIKVTVNPTPRATPVNINNLKPDSSICFGGSTNILLTTPTVTTSGTFKFDYKVSVSGVAGVVTGDTTRKKDILPGDYIIRSYQNSSDTIQSVFFHLTPKVVGLGCNNGNLFTSEIKVHARSLQSIVVTKPLTCSGGAGLAALRAVLSKGANPYQIVWDGPVGYHKTDSADITNLSSGKYIVKITDNLSCFRKDSISIVPVTARAYLSATIIPPGTFNISCIGSTDGTILASVTGGITPPYRYWLYKNDINPIDSGTFTDNLNLSDPTTYKYVYNLGAGSYTLVTRDKNGCEDRNRIIFRVPPPVVVRFVKSTFGSFNVSCKGYNDGYAKVDTIYGGRGGYSFRWFTINGNIPGPVNTTRIDNITAGEYFLEIKDVLGCTTITNVIITEPNGMLLAGYRLSKSADSTYNISCNGGNNGSIKLNVTGGSGIYICNWTGPNGYTGSGVEISGLVAGTYSATVRDFFGCLLTPSPSFTLTQPTTLNVTATKSIAIDGTNNINCYGGAGSISLTVTGGSIGKYRFTWSTANGSGLIQGKKDQSNPTAGDYHVVVTDTNNCVTSTDITLKQPGQILTQLIPKQITCNPPGFSNGSINLMASGGTGTFTFKWSNGATTEDIANLSQGLYIVKVTDSNQCLKKDSVMIINPPPLTFSDSLSLYNSFNISCYGLSDGSVKITPVTGTKPYVYSWTGPGAFVSSNQSISGLYAGQYNLQITDSNLCKASGIIDLTQPGKLVMIMNPSTSNYGNLNINCAGDSTGSIKINPINGVGTVNYLWSDGAVGSVRSNLPAGKYSIIITDQNNCHADSSIVLTQPDSIKTSFEVKQAFCPDSPDGEIHLKVKGGVIVSDYSYLWSDKSTTQNLANILKGLYKVTVTDANNCFVEDSVLMEPAHETCLMIPNAISPNNDNINDVWNIGKIELYPNAEVKVFNRWGEMLWRSEKGYPRPWDGRSNGALLPIDSYYYIIDLHNGSKPVSGNITVVR